jgi:hypothetical protein
MGRVNELIKITLERDVNHRDVECTWSIVNNNEGGKCLQIDSYGSASRQVPGKKSQSLRFTPKAIAQLKEILAQEF